MSNRPGRNLHLFLFAQVENVVVVSPLRSKKVTVGVTHLKLWLSIFRTIEVCHHQRVWVSKKETFILFLLGEVAVLQALVCGHSDRRVKTLLNAVPVADTADAEKIKVPYAENPER